MGAFLLVTAVDEESDLAALKLLTGNIRNSGSAIVNISMIYKQNYECITYFTF